MTDSKGRGVAKLGVYGADQKLLDAVDVPDDLSYVPPLTIPKGGSAYLMVGGALIPLMVDCPESFRVDGFLSHPGGLDF